MPQVIEIPIDVTKITASPNRSDLIAVNNWQRATLMIQTSAPLSAGAWLLKATLTPDTSIPGQVIATLNFPATPAREASVSVDLPQMLVYVEQQTPPTGGTIEKMSLLVQ
jgi:hypothetical protein